MPATTGAANVSGAAAAAAANDLPRTEVVAVPVKTSGGTARPDAKVPFAGGRYLLSHRLGNGSFGDIFEGYDTLRRCRVAVKLEKKKVRYPQLEYESKVYRVLHQPPVGISEFLPFVGLGRQDSSLSQTSGGGGGRRDSGRSTPEAETAVVVPPFLVIGVPQIFYYDSEGDYNIMVMELCGPSLEDVFNYCHRRFSMKTVLMVAEQMLCRIQYVHERGFVHRDIKPENFTFGIGPKAHMLFVIDFGLSKLYWDCRKNTHIPFVEGKPLTGTARYCSANTHRGLEQSRRDDLESIAFLLIYFLKGSLPWQGIQGKDQQLKTIRIGEKKMATSIEDLCKGLPSEFLRFCQYCRELSFQQKPDYDFLRGLFRTVGDRNGYTLITVDGEINHIKANTNNSGNIDDANGGGNGDNSLSLAQDFPQQLQLQRQKQQLLAPGTRVGGGAHVPTTTVTFAASGKDSVSVLDSHGMTTTSSSSAAAAADAKQTPLQQPPSPRHCGVYDWSFDWFEKRVGEAQRGKEEFEVRLAMAAASQVDSWHGSLATQNSGSAACNANANTGMSPTGLVPGHLMTAFGRAAARPVRTAGGGGTPGTAGLPSTVNGSNLAFNAHSTGVGGGAEESRVARVRARPNQSGATTSIEAEAFRQMGV